MSAARMGMARGNALPFLVACAGVALFSVMDAAMKELALTIGAFNAVFWRNLVGCGIAGAAFVLTRARRPSRAALAVHVKRGTVVAGMSVLFFWGLARIPMAEAIALTFIAPLIALYLAALLLGERIGGAAILASVLGLLGVTVIVAAKFGGGTYPSDAPLGVAALLASSALFAYNLILARQQAQIARPVEIALFQALVVTAWLAAPAALLATPPRLADAPLILGAAALAFLSLLLLSWAYARAEAQVLIPVEYTAFIWAALCGALVFDEALTWPVVAGTVLIVTGSLIVARSRAPAVASAPATEPAAV